jgi:exosome complex exonuclease RRP6
MFFYARADTHFLLYIYDNMRNELIDRTNSDNPEENRIEIVLQKSKETSLLRFEKQIYNAESGRGPGGWYSLLIKTPALFSNEQFAVFRAVHEWRDKIARTDDDSTAFVMSQAVLFSIAKIMPMDMVALLSLAHPVSHSVKSRAGELLEIIKSAKAEGHSGPSMVEVLRPESAKTKTAATSKATEVAQENTLVAVVDQGELRSGSSTFWGGAFGSSIWDTPATTNNDNLRLAVPLPALSSEVFSDSTVLDTLTAEPAARPAPLPAPAKETKKQDELFIIKRGAKRKTEAISEDEESGEERGEYDISLSDPEEEKASRSKAEMKAARKEEKRAKKAAKKAVNVESVGDVDMDDAVEEEAFDYSKAESVLHGKRPDLTKGRDKKKPFDPYAKSADAPKGMRRAQTERAGRSHTFKK